MQLPRLRAVDNGEVESRAKSSPTSLWVVNYFLKLM